MLYTTPEDAVKLREKMETILGNAIETGHTKILVGFDEFYEACKFSKLRKSLFAAEVEDILTGTAFTRGHGTWVFADFGDGYHIFVQIAEAGTSGQVDDLINTDVAKRFVF